MNTLAITSDVHANREALTAVLADIDAIGVDEIVCCGDVVGYGADPIWCVDKMIERGIRTVLGNHDEGAIREQGWGQFNDWARAALDWPRMFELAMDPVKACEYRQSSMPEEEDTWEEAPWTALTDAQGSFVFRSLDATRL